MSDRQSDFSRGSIPRNTLSLALLLIPGGLAYFTAMYFTTYRPLGHLRDRALPRGQEL